METHQDPSVGLAILLACIFILIADSILLVLILSNSKLRVQVGLK